MIPEHENLLCAVRFEEPDYIPMSFHISKAYQNHSSRYRSLGFDTTLHFVPSLLNRRSLTLS